MIRVTATNDNVDGPWVDHDHPEADGWTIDSQGNLDLRTKPEGGPPRRGAITATYPTGHWTRVHRVTDSGSPAPISPADVTPQLTDGGGAPIPPHDSEYWRHGSPDA